MTDNGGFKDNVVRQTTMMGGGAYDAGSQHQRTAIALATPLLERALEECPLPKGDEPFIFVDYGSATGFNSFEPAHAVVSQVRRRTGAHTPVCVVHNDQPGNDFSALFHLVSTSPESYVRTPNVFPFAVGRTFYGPVVPNGFAWLGWSANAVHWLSAAPHAVPGDLWFRRPAGNTETLFSRQARADWHCFLSERARELRPHGQLLVTMVDADERGDSGADHFLDLLCEVLKRKVQLRQLRSTELARMMLPLYYRSEPEIRDPFESGLLREQLQLLEYEHATLGDPLWAAFERTGDGRAFARAHVAWQRGFSEPALFSVLDGDRSPEERRTLVDTIYEELRERVEARPADSRCTWRLALLRMARR